MKLPTRCPEFAIFTAIAASAIPIRAQAEISLFDYAFQRDGVVEVAPAAPPSGSLFDTTTGLGIVQMTFAGAGLHSALLFVDHELSESDNTFFNEVGSTSVGAPPAGLSWEIDEPGFTFGDIFDNFLANSLDTSIGTPSLEDVSMALGWNFVLVDGESAVVRFLLSDTPPSAFHLRHFDPDSGENVYFSSSLSIDTTVVPEGRTLLTGLMGVALALATLRFRHRVG